MLRRCALLLSLFLVPFLLIGTASARADEVFKATSVLTVPGTPLGSFDISFVDPAIGLYLLADRSHKVVQVIDTNSNTILTQLGAGLFRGTSPCVPAAGPNDCAGPNGVLTVNNREAWAGDGDSTIKVFDLVTHKLTHTITTGGTRRADELCFDPRDQLVVMANDADEVPFITFIPTSGPQAYQVVKTLKFPEATNGIEQCQWSARTGKIYLNIPEVNGPGDDTAPGAVYVIDPETMTLERVFDIDHDKCAGPQGMAIGPDNQILLGCNAPSGVTATEPNGNGRFSTVIINDRSGAVIATLDNESGADQVWFNDGDNHYFLARSAAVDPKGDQLLGVVDSIAHREDPSVVTARSKVQRNAHSVAADPVRNQVYVPIPGATIDPVTHLPGPTAGVCSSAGGDDLQGCIAVLTTTNDDRLRGGQ